MLHRIKHPLSFWALIVYLMLTATVIQPHVWSVPIMFLIVICGCLLRWQSHREGRHEV